MAADQVVLGIVIGTLAAIVYSLRVLILLERRIARMDLNIESLTRKILTEEVRIAREEAVIEAKLGIRPVKPKKATIKKVTKKKTVPKRAQVKKVVKKAKPKKATKKRK